MNIDYHEGKQQNFKCLKEDEMNIGVDCIENRLLPVQYPSVAQLLIDVVGKVPKDNNVVIKYFLLLVFLLNLVKLLKKIGMKRFVQP